MAQGLAGKTDRPAELGARVIRYDALRDAAVALNDALSDSPAGDEFQWARRLQAAVVDLADAYADHSAAAESDEGVLNEISKLTPRLASRVERQRADHHDLQRRASYLIDEIGRQRYLQRIWVDRLRLEAGILHDAIRLHMALGADLIYEGYLRVNGGEGG